MTKPSQPSSLHAPMDLTHWPEAAALQLQSMIKANAHCGAYAVFDADNSSYQHDLIGALLPFMEARGVLTRQTMNSALKLIPFLDSASQQESLHSYYLRLCAIDDQISFPWASQIFAGFTLLELKGYLDAMFADGKPIASQCFIDGQLKTCCSHPPQLLRGQQQLYKALMQHGIEVFVVSAASEELVRMVLSDPQYGYHLKPQNVIGVSLLLKDRQTGALTTARQRIAEGCYRPEELENHELTPSLWAPLTWYEGKQAAIHTYIHPWKQPILVVGDSPKSDGPMLFRSKGGAQGALRLFVAHSDDAMKNIQALQARHAAQQQELGLPVTAYDNWLIVTPDQIL